MALYVSMCTSLSSLLFCLTLYLLYYDMTLGTWLKEHDSWDSHITPAQSA